MNEKENKLVLHVNRLIRNNTEGNGGATLTFTKDRLDIRLGLIIKLSFLKEDIISIEPSGPFSIIGADWFEIKHNIKKYPKFLVFSYNFYNYNDILKKIESTGFLDKTSPTTDQKVIDEVRKMQEREIVPKYIMVLIAVFALIAGISIIIHFIPNFF